MPVERIETPALVVDLDALDQNLRTMAAAAAEAGVALRPHAKAHKCPQIARFQLGHGATGVCCQKVGEAEVFVDAGIVDVLITNEIVDPAKVDRLAQLARRARIATCVDDRAQVALLAEAARHHGVQLDVLVEIDVGHGRCGVPPGASAVGLAQLIEETSSLRFAGLQAYQGAAQHLRLEDERRRAIDLAADRVRLTTSLLAESGLACPLVSGGGTGTFMFEAASSEFTEIQPGSYVFMDAAYARNEWAEERQPFAHALLVHATVISTSVRGRAVLDAGYKALAVDSGYPTVVGLESAAVAGMSDEHTLIGQDADRPLRVGDRVRLVPGHIDPTVNLHDWYVGVRDGTVEVVWPIAARGPGL
jgi:D-serine deaminase-like pyridoxal phosphate-dependent protein